MFHHVYAEGKQVRENSVVRYGDNLKDEVPGHESYVWVDRMTMISTVQGNHQIILRLIHAWVHRIGRKLN